MTHDTGRFVWEQRNRRWRAASSRSLSTAPPGTRVLDAALDLFAEHGVSGASLQMIADAVGTTKAAVRHQFRTKDHIVT